MEKESSQEVVRRPIKFIPIEVNILRTERDILIMPAGRPAAIREPALLPVRHDPDNAQPSFPWRSLLQRLRGRPVNGTI